MSIIQTVLVFFGIPLAVMVLTAAAVLGPGAVRAPRYRPGGAWNYNPVWYLPHPAHSEPVSSLRGAAGQPAGSLLAIRSAPTGEVVRASGGASGEW
jgi:hypothetical protein